MNDKLKQRFEEIIKDQCGFTDDGIYYLRAIIECLNCMMQAYAEAEQDKWVSVETPPTLTGFDNQILIYCPVREFEDDKKVIQGWFEEGRYYSILAHEDEVLSPTAWQPLPKSPISK